MPESASRWHLVLSKYPWSAKRDERVDRARRLAAVHGDLDVALSASGRSWTVPLVGTPDGGGGLTGLDASPVVTYSQVAASASGALLDPASIAALSGRRRRRWSRAGAGTDPGGIRPQPASRSSIPIADEDDRSRLPLDRFTLAQPVRQARQRQGWLGCDHGSTHPHLHPDRGRRADPAGGHVGDDKTDPRVEAYGDVDEANSAIGVALATDDLPAEVAARAAHHPERAVRPRGRPVQTADRDRPRQPDLRVTQAYVDRLEDWCDEFSEPLPPLASFILPGGSPGAAQLHVARTVARRAERAAWAAAARYGTEPAAEPDTPGGVNPAGHHLPQPAVRPAVHPHPGRQRPRRGRAVGTRQADRRPATQMTTGATMTRSHRQSQARRQARPVTCSPASGRTCRSTEVCRLAGEWGYDGLEIACWGDHFDVARAAEDDAYVQDKPGHPGGARARLLGDLQPPERPSGVRGDHRRPVQEHGQPAGLGRR